MKRMQRALKVFVPAVLLTTASVVGALAYAAKNEAENDALEVAKAKVSLSQAVTLAEQHLNGKASRAEYERTKQGPAYEIEIVSGDKVFDVRVDAEQGSILSSAPDTGDRGKDREDRDEKD